MSATLAALSKLAGFYGRFLVSFSALGHRARRLGWPRLTARFDGQTWLVTGATGGIGRAVVLQALARGARVIAVARNLQKLDALTADAGVNADRLTTIRADLALERETEALVADPRLAGVALTTLINNVGVLERTYSKTSEGLETSYAINLHNHVVLTEGLHRAGRLAPDAAIVNVASGGLYNVPLALPLFEQPEARFNGFAAYAAHKRAQVALADVWNAEFGGAGLRAYAMHPGWADTEGVQRSLPRFRAVLRSVLRSAEEGADTIVWLAATRPAPIADRVWFDRKARVTHVNATTRAATTTPQAAVDALRARAQSVRAAL